MKERLEAIKKAALEKIEQADAMDSLNDIRVSVLGKKGELTQVLKGMKDRILLTSAPLFEYHPQGLGSMLCTDLMVLQTSLLL